MAKQPGRSGTEILPPRDPLIGKTFGDFTIEAFIGKGGMGVVYKARQNSVRRSVAFKILHPSSAGDQELRQRFQREAEALGRLNHPNIVQVYAMGMESDPLFIAMELVQGEGLDDALARAKKLPAGRVLDIMRQVAAAVAAAHAEGVVHRDIKPGNILITPDGRVKITDFGLAKLQGGSRKLTMAGSVLGTAEYVPPEVAEDGEADQVSDLYSMGATFYHALAAQPPFTAPTLIALLWKVVKDPVPPLAQFAPDAPPALCDIIHKLLEKEPEKRFQNAEDLLAALNRVEVPPPAVEHVAQPAAAVNPPITPPPDTRQPTPILALPGKWQVYAEWPFNAAEAKRRQIATAEALGEDVERKIDLGNGVMMPFLLIPAGEFLMGNSPSPRYYDDEYPLHRVRLTRPFWLGKCPVTQEQWEAVARDDPKPSHFSNRRRNPVEQVSWEMCRGFVDTLSERLGQTFRLPTEAEWEYACRAGTDTQYSFGDDVDQLGAHAWFSSNSGGSTHRVARKQANAWGFHDMHGNVWEWCQDWYGAYKEGAQTDPTGPETGVARVARGGSWNLNPGSLRLAHRSRYHPEFRDDNIGFLLVLAPGP